MLSPWDVLGLDEGAHLGEVKAAYRAYCLRQHPDRLVGEPASVRDAASAAMALANAAYRALLEIAPPAPEPEPEPEPARPTTAVTRYRARTRWDDALAATPARGRIADVAA